MSPKRCRCKETLLTSHELADRLRISERKVRYLAEHNYITRRQIGPRSVRYPWPLVYWEVQESDDDE